VRRLFGRIEQPLPGDPRLARDVGEPARQVRDHGRRLERRAGQVRRDHLAQGVELGPGPLGVAHQGLIEHDAEIASPLTHLLECIAAAAEQVDQRDALGVEQLEGKPHPFGRVLDAGEGVGDVAEQILAPAHVAALVTQRDAQLGKSVLRLAGALRGLGGAPSKALQRHIQHLLLDAGGLGGEAQLLQRLDANPDRIGGLGDRIRCRDRAIDQCGEARRPW
jgi:hypothetical protein